MVEIGIDTHQTTTGMIGARRAIEWDAIVEAAVVEAADPTVARTTVAAAPSA